MLNQQLNFFGSEICHLFNISKVILARLKGRQEEHHE
jgi:hypothetical protein